MPKPEIIDVTEKNIDQYPPVCFLNPKNEGYLTKKEWLKKRFKEGLKIKLLYQDKKCLGYIEYVAGENAWRAVAAKGYLFIHCIWITPNKNKKKGYGSMLVNEAINDAKKAGKLGVAVITSEGPFMASKDLFVKNGFKQVAEAEPSYTLLAKSLKKGAPPKFRDSQKQLVKPKGLNLIYTKQCPWVARFVSELDAASKKKIKLIELKTAKQAQEAPSIYTTLSLIKDGKLLADHYISSTRFKNIMKKGK